MNSSAENNSGSIQAKEKKRGQGQAHELKRKPWQDNKGNRIKEAPQSLSAFWLSKIKDISKGNLSNPEKVDDLMLAYKELSNHPKVSACLSFSLHMYLSLSLPVFLWLNLSFFASLDLVAAIL